MNSAQSLKEIGLKATLPRRKVLELFEQSKVRHLSAEDVYKKLLAEGIDVGLATVYRVLTQFEQAGLLARQHFETGKAVFELNQGGHHDHLVCLQCGRVEEFYDPDIEKRQTEVARQRGFALRGHRSRSTPTAPRRTAPTGRPSRPRAGRADSPPLAHPCSAHACRSWWSTHPRGRAAPAPCGCRSPLR